MNTTDILNTTCADSPVFSPTAFCEAKSKLLIHDLFVEGSSTEVGNAVSSLIGMSFFGLMGLFYTKNDQPSIARVLWSLLFLNGIGSTLYHGSGYKPFSTFDGITMLGLVCIGMFGIFTEIVHENTNDKILIRMKSLVALLAMSYWIAATIIEKHGSATAFRVMFGIPMGVFATVMIYMYVKIDDLTCNKCLTDQLKKRVRTVLIIGWSTGFGALGFWLLDLLLCEQTDTGVLFGHWLWHILIAYFASCIINLYIFFQANNVDMVPDIKFVWGFIPVAYWLKKRTNESVITFNARSINIEDINQDRSKSYYGSNNSYSSTYDAYDTTNTYD